VSDSLTADIFVRKHLDEKLLLIDVRSEKEFAQAHIPGAINIPLLNDDHRKQVGITYKSNGREAAVVKGFDLVGDKFGSFIREVKRKTSEKHVMIYCWRGGMRSGIMSWILEMGGLKCFLLKGGYKFYRRFVFEVLEQPKKVVVVGGKTGCGKTEILDVLKKKGEQVICLETLASHRGSAFGALGKPLQPRNEMFQNMLAEEWLNVDPGKILFLENESLTIGPIVLPPRIYEAIRSSPVVELQLDLPHRLKRILAEYGEFPVEALMENTLKLSKRLGGLRTQQAVEALQDGNKEKWVELVLSYYDSAYGYSNDSRKNILHSVSVTDEPSSDVAEKVLEAAREFQM
jgi:tRNA 2-selenouridine synthase